MPARISFLLQVLEGGPGRDDNDHSRCNPYDLVPIVRCRSGHAEEKSVFWAWFIKACIWVTVRLIYYRARAQRSGTRNRNREHREADYDYEYGSYVESCDPELNRAVFWHRLAPCLAMARAENIPAVPPPATTTPYRRMGSFRPALPSQSPSSVRSFGSKAAWLASVKAARTPRPDKRHSC